MKKNGFTLIEILVSIVLVSVIMIFMVNALIKLKDLYASSDNDTDMIVFSSVMSKIVNEDIEDAGGISSISCTDTTCNIVLKNLSKRKLTIYNTDNGENIKSTIEYYDSTKNKILSINTIYYDKTKSKTYYYNKLSCETTSYALIGNLTIITVEIKSSDSNDTNHDLKFYSYTKE